MKTRPILMSTIRLANTLVKPKDGVKILGVSIDHTMSFIPHIKASAAKR